VNILRLAGLFGLLPSPSTGDPKAWLRVAFRMSNEAFFDPLPLPCGKSFINALPRDPSSQQGHICFDANVCAWSPMLPAVRPQSQLSL
jgi:hypothetical protein